MLRAWNVPLGGVLMPSGVAPLAGTPPLLEGDALDAWNDLHDLVGDGAPVRPLGPVVPVLRALLLGGHLSI